jgi:hypothetical protein
VFETPYCANAEVPQANIQKLVNNGDPERALSSWEFAATLRRLRLQDCDSREPR